MRNDVLELTDGRTSEARTLIWTGGTPPNTLVAVALDWALDLWLTKDIASVTVGSNGSERAASPKPAPAAARTG